MQVRTSGIAGLLDNFSFSDWLKGDPIAAQKQADLEKSLALQAGTFPASYGGQPSGQIAGTKMQNTADLKFNLTIDPTRTDLPGVLNFTSPVIPDFLKNATTINTTTKVPSPGQLALAMQTPWYKDRKYQLIAGGIAIVAAALFVFTGNSNGSGKKRK